MTALQLNDLKITPRDGAYVYMPNVPQPHNVIVSPNQATALKAGDIVTLDTTVANAHCPVIKKAAVNDPIFGVIPYDVRKNAYVANEKTQVAIEGSYIYKTAAASIAQGAKLYFDVNGQVTSSATAGNSILGVANTSAAAKDDFVQVKLHFETTSA
jgi:predicted RecA/RadA family phage recombinase